MQVPIERKSDEEMRREYPIADRVLNWYFRLTETSSNAWLVEGSDVWGRTISRQGDDPDELLENCVKEATSRLLKSETVSFDENRLFVGSEQIATFDYPIRDAFANDTFLIVMLNKDAYPKETRRCENLLAVDLKGQTIWVAQLPTTSGLDAYYRIESRKPLVAYSIASYDCRIDLRTGAIERKEFYK